MLSPARLFFLLCTLAAFFGCNQVVYEPPATICSRGLTQNNFGGVVEVADTDVYLVGLQGISVDDGQSYLADILGADDVKPILTHGRLGRTVFSVRITNPATLTRFINDQSIIYVEPTGVVSLHEDATPSAVCVPVTDQFVPYGIVRTEAPNVWEQTVGQGVVAITIDSGISLGHSDLPLGRIIGGKCVRQDCEEDDIKDQIGHGTHVAGIIGAEDNDTGVVGMSPGVSFYIIKIFGGSGGATKETVVAGIDEATRYKLENPDVPMVVNMSFGGSGSDSISDAIAALGDSGAIIVASAGNEGDGDETTVETMGMPAVLDDSIAVAAMDVLDAAMFSVSNPKVELTASGVGVVSDMPGNTIAALSGTSMSGPHIAGAVALLLAHNIQVEKNCSTSSCIRIVLDATAQDYGEEGRDVAFGFGEPRMVAAFEMLENLPRH